MVRKVLKDNVALAAVCEDKDSGSDIEDGPPNQLPTGLIPSWRSSSLTSILHCLDAMVQAQATHHQTIKNNQALYGQSQKLIKTITGLRGVPRDFPQDCYEKVWWETLSPFEQQTVSRVAPIGLETIAQNLEQHCRGATTRTGSGTALGPSAQKNNKRRLDGTLVPGSSSGCAGEGGNPTSGKTMNVD